MLSSISDSLIFVLKIIESSDIIGVCEISIVLDGIAGVYFSSIKKKKQFFKCKFNLVSFSHSIIGFYYRFCQLYSHFPFEFFWSFSQQSRVDAPMPKCVWGVKKNNNLGTWHKTSKTRFLWVTSPNKESS